MILGKNQISIFLFLVRKSDPRVIFFLFFYYVRCIAFLLRHIKKVLMHHRPSRCIWPYDNNLVIILAIVD